MAELDLKRLGHAEVAIVEPVIDSLVESIKAKRFDVTFEENGIAIEAVAIPFAPSFAIGVETGEAETPLRENFRVAWPAGDHVTRRAVHLLFRRVLREDRLGGHGESAHFRDGALCGGAPTAADDDPLV